MGRTSSTVKDRYNKKSYDTYLLRLKKGEKEKVESYAKAQGQSMNGFITGLIYERMGLSGSEESTEAAKDSE